MAAMLTPRDLAAAWQCSAGHIRKLLRTGQLRAMRLGSDWRISPADADSFVAGHTNAAPTHGGRAVAVQPVLTVVPPGDMDGALPYGWWESPADRAASPAAGSGRSARTKKALVQRSAR